MCFFNERHKRNVIHRNLGDMFIKPGQFKPKPRVWLHTKEWAKSAFSCSNLAALTLKLIQTKMAADFFALVPSSNRLFSANDVIFERTVACVGESALFEAFSPWQQSIPLLKATAAVFLSHSESLRKIHCCTPPTYFMSPVRMWKTPLRGHHLTYSLWSIHRWHTWQSSLKPAQLEVNLHRT